MRWEGKNGKVGYSPAHIRWGWFASKAEARTNREFLPLTDAVIRDLPQRQLTAGVSTKPLAERRDAFGSTNG